ncbi:MAG: flagellar biosynthesis protein FlhF [Deferribacteraceae bacterium]|jgi:flagellar biosynthesis protein FlhF|nr:flagellar biosynthesis protein FlhF [Deferribacteraceae bacterium]
MKIKKYEVTDMKEALRQIKQELGPDAVILTTRKVMKPSGLGLLSRQVLEVTAAVDYDKLADKEKNTTTAPTPTPEPKSQVVRSPLRAEQKSAMANPTYKLPAAATPKLDLYEDDEISVLPPIEEYIAPTPPPPPQPELTMDKFADLLKSMGLDKVGSLLADVGSLKEQIAEIKSSMEEPDTVNVDLPQNLKEFYQILIKNGLDELISYRLLKGLDGKLPDLIGKGQLRNIIVEALAEKIPVEDESIFALQNKITMFIGPTGVGKTTTIAKIAADLVLKYTRKVCLITVDIFRIGAVEQLKTYAEIVNLPLYIATSPEELARILEETTPEFDYILLDSTGRSPYDDIKLGDTMEYLAVSESIVPVLVLSMAANQTEFIEIYDRYADLEPQYLVFTKLDETRRFGALVNVSIKKDIPLLLLSNGQGVPDDMEIPDGKKIAKKLLQEMPTLWKDN